MVPVLIFSVPEEVSIGNPDPQNKTVVAITFIVGMVSLGALMSIVIWKSLTGVIYDC